MLLAPLSFVAHERLLARWLERRKPPEFDTIDGPGNPVIIAGYGRYGQIVSRVLRMAGIPFTALEVNYQQVDFVRRFGNKVYYGDASRLELLDSAKARRSSRVARCAGTHSSTRLCRRSSFAMLPGTRSSPIRTMVPSLAL